MTHAPATIKGVMHGKMIELESDAGLPEGQRVSVTVRAVAPAGEGLRRAFGSWSDDPAGVDQFVDQVFKDRENDPRSEMPS